MNEIRPFQLEVEACQHLGQCSLDGECISKSEKDNVAALVESLRGPHRDDVGKEGQWCVMICNKQDVPCEHHYDKYEDYHNQFEAFEIIVEAAGVALSGYNEDGEKLMRAVSSAIGRYQLRPAARRHIGACIDCFNQATGLDVPNPTGVKEMRTDKTLGWKKPRTSLTTGA